MTVTAFLFPRISEKTKMRVWLGTAPAGQEGQTRGSASAREKEIELCAGHGDSGGGRGGEGDDDIILDDDDESEDFEE